MATVKFDDYLKTRLEDEEFKADFLAEKAILESAVAVFNARQNAGLTQRQLARLSRVPRSTIARIENGHNTGIETLSKITFALNQKLTISIG